MKKSELKQILEELGVFATKARGQNFLIDENIALNITDNATKNDPDLILEIGPGIGMLTKNLPQENLLLIEYDKKLYERLKPYHNIIHQDASRVDYEELLKDYSKVNVVSNLPYNIAVPIIKKLTLAKSKIQSLTLMLQKEQADRMQAEIRTKEYGRLRLLIEEHYEINELFKVPKESFFPVPKVTSCVIELKPKTIDLGIKNRKIYSKLLEQAFGYRRKQLRQTIKKLDLDITRLDEKYLTARPDSLSLEDFVNIANILS